ARMVFGNFRTLVVWRLPLFFKMLYYCRLPELPDCFKILYCRLALALGRPLPLRFQVRYYLHQVAIPSKNAYVPQVFAGQLTLFLNRESYVSRPEAVGPDLGWGRFAGGGLTIVDMPGRHGDMLNEPVVQLLAERLKECLQGTCNSQDEVRVAQMVEK